MSRLPIVSAAALRAAVSVRDLIGPVAHAFVEYSAGRGAAPITVLHPTSHSDLHIKAAVLDGHDLVTVKAAGWSARLAETDGAASSGFIAVFSAATCRPIALLVDDHYLTDIRTAAAGAVRRASWRATRWTLSGSSVRVNKCWRTGLTTLA